MGEWTSTLRAQDAHALDALYAAIADGGRGRTVFVAGDDRAGRAGLLQDWLDGLTAMPVAPRVLGGVFEHGEYVPWERDRAAASAAVAALERLLSIAGAVVTLAEVALPPALCMLLGQVLSKSKAALELTHRALAQPGDTSSAMLVPRALRRLCEDGPVVCVIETADLHAGGLWADLVERFARRVAKDVPLLLVLSLDGPERLGAHTEDEPAGLNVARQLTADDVDVATWRWLAPLTEQDLSRWTGRCAPGVLDVLLQVTAGRGGFSTTLWREWRALGVVEDLTDGSWRFSDGRDHIFDEVDDLVYERVQRLDGVDVNTRDRARRLLSYAALEGRRFTAPAVAAAGGWDPDDTIDLLDDVLVYDDEDSPEGFVVDTGFVTVSDEHGTRHLATYRFARELDWMTLRHHGLSDAEERHVAPRLVDPLAAFYGDRVHRVATTLRRLYALAGDADNAAYFRRMADNGLHSDVLLWRARTVLADGDPSEPAERRRATALMLVAARELGNSGPFEEGLEFATTAHRLAEAPGDQVTGTYLRGVHLMHLGAYEDARSELGAAARLYVGLRDRSGEAKARYEIAVIDRLQGAHDRARAQLVAVRDLCHELGDRSGEAATGYELAGINLMEGDHTRARAELAAALELSRELGDGHMQAAIRKQLGAVARLQGDRAGARAELVAVLDLYRELHDRSGEANVRYELAMIDVEDGEHAHARTELVAVRDICRELGEHRGEVETGLGLARIDVLQADYARARAELASVHDLARELGDRGTVGKARYELAWIDRLEGDLARARAQFAEVLDLCVELGDHSGEAACRAAIDELDSQ